MNTPDYKPTLVSEFRRSLYSWVYSMDMSVVFFTGRPPLLSSAYSSTPLPLDLNHEDLLSGGDALDAAVRRLDEDGWRVTSEVRPATVGRARASIALIKEKILRIALGHEEMLSSGKLLYV